MGFYNVNGLVSMLAVPVIIMFYLLKEQYKKETVSSDFIWSKLASESKSQEKLQKLKKNKLMLLQILCALLIGFALSNPYLIDSEENKNHKDYIFILDLSLSMQTINDDKNNTRFENAKSDLISIIENSSPESKFSLITLGDYPLLAFSSLNEKSQAVKIINNISPEFGNSNLSTALDIINSEKNTLSTGEVTIFTDEYNLFPYNINEEFVYNNLNENSAISLFNYVENNNDISVLVRINDYVAESSHHKEKNISLFVDDVIFDSVSFLPTETSTDIVFQGISKNAKSLMVKLSPDDNLLIDNMAYTTVNLKEKEKSLLVSSEYNIFLEKVLGLMDNIELYESNISDFTYFTNNYGLYIFNGFIPDDMPKDGNILVINPPVGSYFDGNIIIGENIEIQDDILINSNKDFPFSNNVYFYLKNGKPIEFDFGNSFLTSQNKENLGVYGTYNNQNIAILSFDLFNSDLPLKMEFPIMFNYIFQWFFSNTNLSNNMGDFYIGERPFIKLKPTTITYEITSPYGEKIKKDTTTNDSFIELNEIGIYKITEFNQQGEESLSYLASNFLIDNNESNLIGNLNTHEENDLENNLEKSNSNNSVAVGKDLSNWFLLLLCLIIIIEWRVSCNEN